MSFIQSDGHHFEDGIRCRGTDFLRLRKRGDPSGEHFLCNQCIILVTLYSASLLLQWMNCVCSYHFNTKSYSFSPTQWLFSEIVCPLVCMIVPLMHNPSHEEKLLSLFPLLPFSLEPIPVRFFYYSLLQ